MGYFIIIASILIVGGTVYLFIDERNQDRLAIEEFSQEWREEQSKPKYRIAFKINGDLLFTDPINPYKFGDGASMLSYIRTSKDLAQVRLRNAYDAGFFQDSEGKTYPACNVETAYVEVVNE